MWRWGAFCWGGRGGKGEWVRGWGEFNFVGVDGGGCIVKVDRGR